MKNKWSNYALKDGKVKESYLRERIGRDKKRKTAKTSSSNCLDQSRQEQEKVRGTNEAIRKEEPSKTYQKGQQRIQESTERRCSVEETNHESKNGEEVVKKETMKHKKHEASETKAYEKKEDKKEVKKEAKKKK
jgi:hypothetical protein